MAFSNSRPLLLLQTNKPFSLLLVALTTFSLLLLSKVNAQGIEDIVLLFNHSRFVPNQQDLIYQGDALVSSTGVLELTRVRNGQPVSGSVGRALYTAPLHIWDPNKATAISFATIFSFVVASPSSFLINPAEGLAFFLAPTDTEIPIGSSGGLLGLFNNRFYNSSRRIVAVEFDSFINSWDPPGSNHIGIDVNAIQSFQTVPWNRRNGTIATVLIYYLAPFKLLGVGLSYTNSQIIDEIYHLIDLKSVLPEWVRFGFSAATGNDGNHVQSHDVLSWVFGAFRFGSNTVEDEKSLRDAMLQQLLHQQRDTKDLRKEY